LPAGAPQGLDQVQAYILVRRWYAGSAEARVQGLAGGLSGAQQREVAAMYHQERMSLLKATEALLWLGEGAPPAPPSIMQRRAAPQQHAGSRTQPRVCPPPRASPSPNQSVLPACGCLPGAVSDAGPYAEVLESTLGALLGAGLEDATSRSLGASLGDEAGQGAAAQPLALAGAAPMASPLEAGAGGSARRALLEQEASLERCTLLTVLILIFYHPRRAGRGSRRQGQWLPQDRDVAAAWRQHVRPGMPTPPPGDGKPCARAALPDGPAGTRT
jgi:hypothetical protein